jgi:hypothetical protein
MDAQNIEKCLREIEDTGHNFKFEEIKETKTWKYSASEFALAVVIRPGKWLGLQFDLLDAKGSTTCWYCTDSDLYNISDPKNAEFSRTISEEIIEILSALLSNRVQVGWSGSKTIMAIPLKGEYLLIKSRWKFTSEHMVESLHKIKRKGIILKPLKVTAVPKA